MGCDLDVDTTRIRQVATLLREAADGFRSHHSPHTYPSHHAAGVTPEGRQALRMITARSAQAPEAAQLLAATAERLAGLLATTADRFDTAEILCAAGG